MSWVLLSQPIDGPDSLIYYLSNFRIVIAETIGCLEMCQNDKFIVLLVTLLSALIPATCADMKKREALSFQNPLLVEWILFVISFLVLLAIH